VLQALILQGSRAVDVSALLVILAFFGALEQLRGALEGAGALVSGRWARLAGCRLPGLTSRRVRVCLICGFMRVDVLRYQALQPFAKAAIIGQCGIFGSG
jgi:hypothetical protein